MNDPNDPLGHLALNVGKQSNAEPCAFRFSELADGKSELLIEHQGQTYLLRVTKNGKLLLNK